MATKIRLARRGRKKRVFYHIVVADTRAPRDGKFIEKLGVYNPLTNPATIEFDQDKALDWIMKGAQPTDTVRAMLSYKGVMFRKHLQMGVNKGAITQEAADKKYEEWMKAKDGSVEDKKNLLAKNAADAKKKALDAEKAKSDVRAEAIKAKETEAIAAEEAAKAAAEAEANPEAAEEAPATEEAPAPEAAVEETPAAEAPAEEEKKAE